MLFLGFVMICIGVALLWLIMGPLPWHHNLDLEMERQRTRIDLPEDRMPWWYRWGFSPWGWVFGLGKVIRWIAITIIVIGVVLIWRGK